jgi:hypothetical protein
MEATRGSEEMRHALTRRGLLGGAAAGAVGLGLSRWASVAGALEPIGPGTTYAALRDALTPLDTTGKAVATADFDRWWLGQDEHSRAHVRRVFDGLDRGAGGSFARASRTDRADLLDDWTHPAGDPLRDASVRDRLSLGTAAISIAQAPRGVDDGRVPLI